MAYMNIGDADIDFAQTLSTPLTIRISDDREITKSLKEWFVSKIRIMFLKMCFSGLANLNSYKFESFLLKPCDDWSDKSTLNSVWLDHNI